MRQNPMKKNNNILRFLRFPGLTIVPGGMLLAMPTQCLGDVGFTTAETLFPELVAIYQTTSEKAPSLHVQYQSVGISEGNAFVSASEKYPDLRLIANGGYARNVRQDAAATDIARADFSLALEHPIYKWGAVKAQDRIGEIDVTLARNNYRRFYQALVSQVRSLYLDLVLEKTTWRNKLLREKIIRKLIKDQTERQRLGTVSEEETILVLIDLKESLLRIEQDRLSMERDLQQFRHLTGFDRLFLEAIPETIPQLTFSKDAANELLLEFIENGMMEKSEWRIKEDQINKAREKLTISKSRNRPLLGLLVSARQEQRDTSARDDVPTLVYFGGFQVKWDIFDGFATKGRTLANIAQIRLLELQLKDMQSQFTRQVEELASDLSLEHRFLELKEERFRVGVKKWGRVQLDWANKVISELQYLQGQSQHFERERKLYESRSRFLLKSSDFLSLVGHDPAMGYYSNPTR